ncbi:hypothetical protein [Kocuria turfanensis]|uniref:Uncharacterized protein n=1 Tax=Kocuria turfanensis TaxID=388357 RepID=A0A512IBY7_9MICC|nr:hypothetical protein [Kocuria turfanensis]GEO95215.1 hypothetical protein KTU01_13380 [Kocuria turfanensis]
MSRSPQDMKTAPVHVAKQNTGAAAPAATNEQGHVNSTTHSTAEYTPMGRAPGHEMTPEAVEDIAIRRIFDGDPLALACHRLGLESRAQPQPMRLHPEDVDLIAQQVVVLLSLGQESVQTARAAQKGAGRYTGTALGDRANTDRTNDPYPTHTAQELNEIETTRGAAA